MKNKVGFEKKILFLKTMFFFQVVAYSGDNKFIKLFNLKFILSQNCVQIKKKCLVQASILYFANCFPFFSMQDKIIFIETIVQETRIEE